MDIQKIITDLLAKLQADKKLTDAFQKDPIGTVKSLLGSVGIDEKQLRAIADGIAAKLKLDNVAGASNTLGSLFGNK